MKNLSIFERQIEKHYAYKKSMYLLFQALYWPCPNHGTTIYNYTLSQSSMKIYVAYTYIPYSNTLRSDQPNAMSTYTPQNLALTRNPKPKFHYQNGKMII